MRVLFWYCRKFAWRPAKRTLDDAAPAVPAQHKDCVVAFVHVEPEDNREGSRAETKLVKNAKWLARKWNVSQIILHSFTHLGEEKAAPDEAREFLLRAGNRLEAAGYKTVHTPYGYYLDLDIQAPGDARARIYKTLT